MSAWNDQTTPTAIDSSQNPWDRQLGEGPLAFEAFVKYRDLGYVRTRSSVAQELNKSVAIVSRWSIKYRWRERVAEWDLFCDQIQQRVTAHQRVEFHKASLILGDLLQRKAMEALQALAVVAEKNGKAELQLSPTEVIRLIECADKLQSAHLSTRDSQFTPKIPVIFQRALTPLEEKIHDAELAKKLGIELGE